MVFDFKSYKPIDYRNWILGDKAREGINIKKLDIINPTEKEILDLAVPYQDQRDDPGQGEMVTYFAIKLLDCGMPGGREIAVPAAILHDTGFYHLGVDWITITRTGGETSGERVRRPHQNRGIMVAGYILKEVDYDLNRSLEISEIIGDHDTRKLPTTDNGNVVRGADMLWRLTYPNLQIYFPDYPIEKALDKFKSTGLDCKGKKLKGITRKIGRIEMVNTLYYKFKDKAVDVLKEEYSKELDKVRGMYK